MHLQISSNKNEKQEWGIVVAYGQKPQPDSTKLVLGRACNSNPNGVEKPSLQDGRTSGKGKSTYVYLSVCVCIDTFGRIFKELRSIVTTEKRNSKVSNRIFNYTIVLEDFPPLNIISKHGIHTRPT